MSYGCGQPSRARQRPSVRGLTKWGHIEQVIDTWAQNFRSQLDTWHGR